jgi:D-alanyl-D-alanine carboxypeptidase (penicillin-binding protein 5/6)
MLQLYEGADGVKTGYTKLAKRCLVSSATRNGQQLAVVTLNDPDDWADHAKLLNYGFSQFPLLPLIHKGDRIESTEWVAGASFSYPTEQSEIGRYTYRVEMNDTNSASYRLGEGGRLSYMLGGETIGSIPLFTQDSPRWKLKENAAFSFSKSSDKEASLAEKWLYIIEYVVRVLFTGYSD